MKKTHKRVAGFLGLLAVAAITTTAVLMPAPQTQAAPATEDNLSVRVVNGSPTIGVEGINSGEIITSPEQSFTVTYNNVGTATVSLEYTDTNGTKTTFSDFSAINPDFADGSTNYVLQFNPSAGVNQVTCTPDGSGTIICTVDMVGDGFGAYILTVEGDGAGGESSVVAKTFSYLPTYADPAEDSGEGNDDPYIDIHYNRDDGSDDPTGDVARVEIKVYYPGTRTEVPFSPIIPELNDDGTTRVKLPFKEYGLAAGNYAIEIFSYDRYGNLLGGQPYALSIEYKGEEDVAVPDTGGLFKGTNISQTDFLVTGLIVFGIVALAGTAFVIKSGKKKNGTSGRRR